jgi:putative flippase GtrA
VATQQVNKQSKKKRNELGRFSLVGGGATLIDYTILNLLANVVGWPLVAANIVSATTSSTFSYILNKKVVFKDKAHSERKTLLLYIGTLIISIFVLQSLILWILDSGLMEGFFRQFGLHGKLLEIVSSNASKVVAGFCTLGWNFMTQRKFVFKSHDETHN